MKTCLITGASGGVATALATRLRAAGWISGQVIGLDGGFQAVRPYVKTA